MVAKYLKSKKFNVNHVGPGPGYTVLLWAIVRRNRENIEIVIKLLKYKDNMWMSEAYISRQTPLQVAHKKGFMLNNSIEIIKCM
jgi:hypothetical protein